MFACLHKCVLSPAHLIHYWGKKDRGGGGGGGGENKGEQGRQLLKRRDTGEGVQSRENEDWLEIERGRRQGGRQRTAMRRGNQ